MCLKKYILFSHYVWAVGGSSTKFNLEMSPFFAEKLTYWWLGYLPDKMNGMQSETVERNFPHLHNNGP